jgi:hypothetical protein
MKMQFLIFFICSFFSLKTIAQEPHQKNQVTLKFENYSVEEDKSVKLQLFNYHIRYTCIPAGIMILELNSTQTIENLKLDLSSGKKKSNYSVVDITIETAENTCATYRTVN